MTTVKHIFFDLDRTLWDFDKNSREALSEIFIQKQLSLRGVPSFDEFLITYRELNEYYWNQYRIGELDKETLRYIRFYETLKTFKVNDKNLAISIGDDYVNISPRKTHLFPHTINTLEHLKSKDYILHIITNGFSEIQDIKLANTKIDHYFDNVITSEAAGVKKPDPRIFDFALKKASANPAESLMIGDEPYIDVKGALDFGMKGLVFNPKGEKEHEFNEITCLSDLRTILNLPFQKV